MEKPAPSNPPLTLRPFIPARDFERSKRFYEELGFEVMFADGDVAVMCSGAAQFLLQNFFEDALASNLMLQLVVEDTDRWWNEHRPERLVEQFDLKAPKPPAMQPWGLKVGFIHDPSGVLWHIAELPPMAGR